MVGDYCGITVVSDDGQWLEPRALFDTDPEMLGLVRRIMQTTPVRVSDRHPTAEVFRTGKTLLIKQLTEAGIQARVSPEVAQAASALRIQSLLIAPLRAGGKPIGVLVLLRHGPHAQPFDEHDVQLAEHLAGHAALAIANARLYQEARAARQRFDRLAGAGILGFLVADLDGNVAEVNDTLLETIGYSREEVLDGALRWRELTPDQYREMDARAIEQLRATGVCALREKEYVRKDGRRVPVLCGAAMLDEAAGRTISFVLDLSELARARQAQEHHRAEAQREAAARERAEAALADKEAELRRLELRATREELARQQQVVDRFFTLSLDMLCIADVDGYFRRVSPAFEVLGYTDNELCARPFIEFVHPDDIDATLAEVSKLRQGVRTIRFENRYRCKDGSYRWLAWTAAPDETGTLYAIARDVTDTRLVEDELRRARDAANTANRELEGFSYSVAHDLRAPLRGVIGFAQLLTDAHANKLDAEALDWLEEIRGGGRRMSELIDALLSLARVSRDELRPEPVHLSAIANSVLAELAAEAPRTVDAIVEDQLWAVLDPRLARVLLHNLLTNAWKFTSRVSAPRIEVGARSDAAGTVFYVRDNGAGFDMRYMEKLFTPFQRLHRAVDFPGTGIGLATVQRIVHLHGGRVWAEGAVGRGATFHFTVGGDPHRSSPPERKGTPKGGAS
jgi:PAS domain S-box-containing protein